MPPIIARPVLRPFINFLHPRSSTTPTLRRALPSRFSFPRTYQTKSSSIPPPKPPALFTRARPIAYLLFGILIGGFTHLYSMHDFIKYTDAESLTLFVPSTPLESEVDNFINNHPLAVSLRANPAFKESRPTLKVKEEHRNASLTSGILSGAGRIVVPPVVWVEDEGKSLVAMMYLGDEICGYPGLIHGGILATLLDEGLARASFAALPNGLAMTASLSIQYRKPSPANSYVVLRAETEKVEGRKAWIKGRIETLPKEGEGEPVVLVEAEALFIEPRDAGKLVKLVGKP